MITTAIIVATASAVLIAAKLARTHPPLSRYPRATDTESRCPHCHAPISPAPRRGRNCRACGKKYHVRRIPLDDTPRIVPPSAIARIEMAWSRAHTATREPSPRNDEAAYWYYSALDGDCVACRAADGRQWASRKAVDHATRDGLVRSCESPSTCGACVVTVMKSETKSNAP